MKTIKVIGITIVSLIVIAMILLGSLYFLLRHSGPDCMVADQVTMLDQGRYKKQKVTLVLRISGFQDKVRFIELYKSPVTFGSCGKASPEHAFISGDSIDEPERGPRTKWISRISVKEGRLVIHYTKNQRNSIIAEKVKLPATMKR